MSEIIRAAGEAAVEVFRRDLIANLQRNIAANRRALDGLRNALLGEGYVVRSHHGLVMDYDTERVVGGAFNVVNPRPAGAATARRFTLADAERVARNTRDGTGEPFEAVHVLVALADVIKTDERLVAELQQHA